MPQPVEAAVEREGERALRRAESTTARRRAAATLLITVLLSALALSACGGDDERGPTELKFFIFNEPSGILPKIADACSKQSDGEYAISFEYLPSDADQQREQLVRRLGAEDDSIDIMGMDVIWTGEFANAGWVEQFKGKDERQATKGIFPSVAETARFEDKLWAAPIWSNTELLWYRKDRVKTPPKTWDEMYQQGREDRREQLDRGSGKSLRRTDGLVQLDGRGSGHDDRRARRRAADRARAGSH